MCKRCGVKVWKWGWRCGGAGEGVKSGRAR